MMRIWLLALATGLLVAAAALAGESSPAEKGNSVAAGKDSTAVRQKLRACMEETSALMSAGGELRSQRLRLDETGRELELKKVELEASRRRVEGLTAGAGPDYDRAVAKYNRQTREYLDRKRAFDAAGDRCYAGGERLKQGFAVLEGHCASLKVTDEDLDAVCGNSENPFCTSYEGE